MSFFLFGPIETCRIDRNGLWSSVAAPRRSTCLGLKLRRGLSAAGCDARAIHTDAEQDLRDPPTGAGPPNSS